AVDGNDVTFSALRGGETEDLRAAGDGGDQFAGALGRGEAADLDQVPPARDRGPGDGRAGEAGGRVGAERRPVVVAAQQCAEARGVVDRHDGVEHAGGR